MLLPAAFYIAWDIYFTALGVWSFNEKYVTGIHIFNLPVEEVLFFFVIPYCCVFIYACVKVYLPRLRRTKGADLFFLFFALLMLVTGIYHAAKYYTSWTFIFTSITMLLILMLRNYFKSFNTLTFLFAYAISLLPFLIVNGFLTALPVVLYNDAENLGIRIFTIPAEDSIYGLLLILMNVVLYEKLKSRSAPD